MADYLHRWMAVVAVLLGLALLAVGLYLTMPNTVGPSHFSPSAVQRAALTNGTKFSTPQACVSNRSLDQPVYFVSAEQANRLLTVRTGDQAVVLDDSESPLFVPHSPLCLVQWSDPGGYVLFADQTGTMTIYIARPGRLSVVDIRVIPSYNELPGFLVMGLGAVLLAFALYVLSKTRRRSAPSYDDLRRADDAQTGFSDPDYGRAGADAVNRSTF